MPLLKIGVWLLWFLISCLIPLPVYATNASSQDIDSLPTFLYRKHRFQRYPKKEMERLVFEFERNHGSMSRPKVVPGEATQKTLRVFEVSPLKLMGTFPQSRVAHTLLRKSRYVTNIQLTHAKTLIVEMNLRDPDSRIEPFWLENPSRLVIDIFGPRSSPQRISASEAPPKIIQGPTGFFCFHAGEQLIGSIPLDSAATPVVEVTSPESTEHSGIQILCYPKTALLSLPVRKTEKKTMDMPAPPPDTVQNPAPPVIVEEPVTEKTERQPASDTAASIITVKPPEKKELENYDDDDDD